MNKKKFISKVIMFCLPALAIIIPPVIVLKLSSECYADIDHAILGESPYLIGYAYNEKDNYRYLKWKEISSKKKRSVMTLGSSRMLQFRNQMFSKSFYNAGYTVRKMTDFMDFLNHIPDSTFPEILIIGLDQWMFNKLWDPGNDKTVLNYSFNQSSSFSMIRNVWADLLDAKYNLFSFSNKENNNDNRLRIGLNAWVNYKGYRNDGSYFRGKHIIKLINKDSTSFDYQFSNTLSRIKNGSSRFNFGDEVNPIAIQNPKELLEYCQFNKINVVGILPPFADQVNSAFQSSGKHSYLEKIYPSIKPVFDDFGFEVWDLRQLKSFNSSDNEMLDGFHGSEVAYLRSLIMILEKKSILNQYTQLNKLKIALENKVNNYVAFDYNDWNKCYYVNNIQ